MQLPKSALIVLIASFKIAERTSIFNFEAVFAKYSNYIKQHKTQLQNIQSLSRQAFLKIFLDLIEKGFLKTQSEVEVLSVNNGISLGFRPTDLGELLRNKEQRERLQLP